MLELCSGCIRSICPISRQENPYRTHENGKGGGGGGLHLRVAYIFTIIIIVCIVQLKRGDPGSMVDNPLLHACAVFFLCATVQSVCCCGQQLHFSGSTIIGLSCKS